MVVFKIYSHLLCRRRHSIGIAIPSVRIFRWPKFQQLSPKLLANAFRLLGPIYPSIPMKSIKQFKSLKPILHLSQQSVCACYGHRIFMCVITPLLATHLNVNWTISTILWIPLKNWVCVCGIIETNFITFE